jgi:parvulin-like peptidyl-prolyl isomerase
MRRWLREPLLHFLLLGLAIFGAFEVLGPNEQPRSAIVVTQGMIDGQVAAFSRTWLRPPTQQEVDELIREYVREEVYYREGMALGLDRDDTVIRRRLQQKLEFVAEAQGVVAEPTDDQLRDYLGAHPDRYRTDERVSFIQVYLNPERHDEALAKDVELLLAELRAGGPALDPTKLGDPTMLERVFDDGAVREVAAQFGDEFASQVAKLPVGAWQGPVESTYGVHAVLISNRTEGRTPQLDEVRDAVRRDWLNEQRVAANEKFYQSLLQRYTVTIEGR